MSRLLFCGDIVGRSGREVLLAYLPQLRQDLALDWVIVNGENSAAGFGITAQLADEFLKVGVDAITTGNHIWDQRSIVPYLAQQPRLLRPLNCPPQSPGQGYVILEKPGHKRLMVVNVMARLFMEPFLDDPFRALETLLAKNPLNEGGLGSIVVDFHGEATSEKAAFAYFFDGKVSLVVGTHTHVPTADGRILPKGTAFQTDIGMCGDYDSIIGMTKETAIPKLFKRGPTERMVAASGPGTLSGVVVDIHEKTGLACRLEPIIIGPFLKNHIPTMS